MLVDPGAVRHVDLDPVGAVRELLARGLAGLDGAVDQLRPFGHVELGRVALQRIAAGRRDRARRDEHPRPRDVAALDRLLDADVAVAGAFGLDVADRREALLEGPARGHGRPGGAQRQPLLQELGVVASLGGHLALQENVRVAVDQPGQDGAAGQVDDRAPAGTFAAAQSPTLSMTLPRITIA